MLNEELSYKYNEGNDELVISLDAPSKEVFMSRYVRGSECLYKVDYAFLEAFAAFKGSNMEAWAFLNKEFEEGRAPEFSTWVIDNAKVGYVDSDYFRP